MTLRDQLYVCVQTHLVHMLLNILVTTKMMMRIMKQISVIEQFSSNRDHVGTGWQIANDFL